MAPWDTSGSLLRFADGRQGHAARLAMAGAGHPASQRSLFSIDSETSENPLPLTIHLESVVAVEPTGVVLDPRVVADIEWGTSGGRYEATVDVLPGTSLGLTASTVSIAMRTFAFDDGGPGAFRVAASVGIGVGGPTVTPTLTEAQIVLGVPGTAIVPVPRWARDLDIQGLVSPFTAASTVLVEFGFQLPFVARQSAGVAFAAGAQPQTVPVPAAARFVRLTNGAQANTYTLRWYLRL